MQKPGPVKGFVARPWGRIVLAAVATATLLGSFLFIGALIAIPTFLFFGLAIPIYLGWKRPRQLAIMGLAALLVAAPIGAFYEAYEYRQPSPAANSDATLPYGNGGPVLQHATVTPYTGNNGGNFTFEVTVNPQFVPKNTSGVEWVELFVTTCPGATGNSSPSCTAGYPFFNQNRSVDPNATQPYNVSFVQALPGPNIWWFQMAGAYVSGANHSVTWIFLDPQNFYGAVQGPVSGDYLSTVGIWVPTFYADLFFYPGAVFFIALLVYYVFKRREAARKARAAEAEESRGPPTGPAAPSSPSTSAAPTTPSGTKPPAAAERRCPSCNAVVYANETSCWKCGTKLSGPTEAPLVGGTS